ncbi:septal ring lytic transglycosylase RlpA family protein [Luteimonas sp. MJ174]|uniref:septal ring lytic transglycosylase RlpA family protein n=1 Tax=Luteimonas sp. MJ174 TaxID=3129237 RepID=UPI0031BB26C1
MRIRRARPACWWTAAAVAALLAGCAGAPSRQAPPGDEAPRGGGASTAGPRVSPYAPAQEDPSTRGDYVAGGLYKPGVADTTPDYVPDVDAIPEPEVVALERSRYGNRSPYKVQGRSYHVLEDAKDFVETGLASYYGQKFHGRRTSNQEVYDMYAFTAAHKSLPLPSFARVTNLDNGRSVVVRVNDRGPFHDGRVVDLSYAAAVKIGVHPRGTARVEVRALGAGENARHQPDTRLAAVDPATGLPPGVRVATGRPQPAPPSALDGLVAALPASQAAAGGQLASHVSATTPAAVATTAPVPESGNADWRFDMRQDGRAMTADEFDAWMKSRRARVATGRPGKPDPYGSAAAGAAKAATSGVDAGDKAPVAAAVVAGTSGSGLAPPAAPESSGSAASVAGVLLQVAAFGSRDNAERALALLRGAGIGDARLQDGTAAGKPVWRLRVGPVAPTGVAELGARVASLGFGAPHPVRE